MNYYYFLSLILVVLYLVSDVSSTSGMYRAYKIKRNTTRTFRINKSLGAAFKAHSSTEFNARMYDGDTLLKNETGTVSFSEYESTWTYHDFRLKIDYDGGDDYIVVFIYKQKNAGSALTVYILGGIFGGLIVCMWLPALPALLVDIINRKNNYEVWSEETERADEVKKSERDTVDLEGQ